MELWKFIFFSFACVWLLASECCEKCSALNVCSVRANVVVSRGDAGNQGGSKCACKEGFYGENCRYKAQRGALLLDAKWHPNGSAIVEWQQEPEDAVVVGYRLSLRRVRYSEEGEMAYGKWRRFTSIDANLTVPRVKSQLFTLPISNASSYEVNIVTSTLSGMITSASVFLDSPYLAASGLDNNSAGVQWATWSLRSRCEPGSDCGNGTQFRKKLCDTDDCRGNNTEEKPCGVKICPGRLYHITQLFEDKESTCFQNGVIVGATSGSVGTLVLIVFVYVLIRQWRMKCSPCKRRHGPCFPENPNFNPNTPDVDLDSQQQLLTTIKSSSVLPEAKSTDKSSSSSRGSGSVAVTIPEGEADGKDVPTGIKSEAAVPTRGSSVAITIEETTAPNPALIVEAAAHTAVASPESSRSVVLNIPETNVDEVIASKNNITADDVTNVENDVNVTDEVTEPEKPAQCSETNVTSDDHSSSPSSSGSWVGPVDDACRAYVVTIGTGDQVVNAPTP